MEEPLVNIEEEGPEWLEWSAAMYESYASDQEWNDGVTPCQGDYTIKEFGEGLAIMSRYCRAAQEVAEDLERKVYEDQQSKIEFDAEYDLAWGCWQERIYDPDR